MKWINFGFKKKFFNEILLFILKFVQTENKSEDTWFCILTEDDLQNVPFIPLQNSQGRHAQMAVCPGSG